MKYATLNDAAEFTSDLNLDPGSTEIWYQRKEVFGKLAGFLKDPNTEVDPADLNKTHVLLGEVCESDPERLYVTLQGENWSPKGEARDLIMGKGLGHTSMSVGDVIVNHKGTFIVDSVGFKKI